MKYKQTHYTDDYGNTIDKGWYKELKYFYKHSILTSASNFETINQFLIQINGVELEYPEELCDKIKEILELDENILEQKLNIAYKIAVDDLTPKPVYESTVNSGTDYEIFIEQILKNADFTVTRTPKTGDQGVDLVVQKMINVSPFNVNIIQNLLAIKLFKKLLLEKIFIIAIVLV